MKNLLRAGALALALIAYGCAQPAAAADPNIGKPVSAFSSAGLPATGIYCPDANGLAAACSFSGTSSGPSAGDPSYTGANASTTVPTSVAETGGYDGTAVRRFLTDTAGRQIVSVYSLPSLAAGTNTIGAISNTSFNIGTGGVGGSSGSPLYGSITNFPSAFDSLCDVVSGDQAYSVGTPKRCTMTPTGRLKVGLSSAGTLGSTGATISDLAGFLDASGNQDAGRTDGLHQIAVVNRVGLGAMAAIPAGSTNGTALGTFPTGGTGARLYLASGDSVTFTVAATAPSSAPTYTYMVSFSGTGPNWDENLAGGQMIYVTAIVGSPKFRWF